MPRYHSKLDAVLQQRKHHEEALQGEFLEMKRALDTAEEQLHRLHQELETALKDFAEQQGAGMAPHEMDLYYRFIKQQYGQLEERRATVQRLADQCERKRQDLLEATREKKVVEKIEANRKEFYFKGLQKKERDLLDELAGRAKKESP
ncbi:MAG: flagellar export protein FliJ [Nitrospirae bacterium]|nr:flagellar export protein FliJ [Candidatus Manganitrophaceae bacterium]